MKLWKTDKQRARRLSPWLWLAKTYPDCQVIRLTARHMVRKLSKA